jgi:hypothetical protein
MNGYKQKIKCMNNTFENKISMYQKVNGYLALHTTETASVAMIATLKTQLDANIISIINSAQIADADYTGATVDKQNKRVALKNAVLKVSTAVVAYAAIANNNKLLEKCDISMSALDYLRDNDFYTYCKLVQAEANPVIASLAPYGVLPINITNLDTAAATFLAAIQDPRLLINEGSRARLDYEIKFSETDDLLYQKLDKVMGIFSSTNISLYNGYKGARSIDDTGSVSEPDYQGQVGPASRLEIATIPYLSGRTFYFKNTGSVPLSFGLDIQGTGIQTQPLIVQASSTVQRISFNLNKDEKADTITVQNADANLSGTYEVRINE